jgi:hypothetical protein
LKAFNPAGAQPQVGRCQNQVVSHDGGVNHTGVELVALAHPGLGCHRTNGNHQNIYLFMQLCSIYSWIFQIAKVLLNSCRNLLFHAALSRFSCKDKADSLDCPENLDAFALCKIGYGVDKHPNP